MYCISKTLAGIPTDCQSNMGGIQKVFIADFVDGLFTLDASGNTVTGVSSAATWYEYNFRAESSNFTSTLNKTADGGNYVSTEIALNFARQETAKRIEMNALALNDMAVVVLDNNQKYWGFGLNRPVTSSAGSAETGTAFGDANRYSITLLSNDANFAPELTAEAIAILKAHIYSGE